MEVGHLREDQGQALGRVRDIENFWHAASFALKQTLSTAYGQTNCAMEKRTQ
jgi:hypothetical protein